MELVTALHPKLVDALSATITEAKARGLQVAIHSGLRTAEEQDKLYALGRTVPNPDGIITNAQAYESWHNLGLAADVVFKDQKGNWTWDKMPPIFKTPEGLWRWIKNGNNQWEQLGQVGTMFNLSWGGYWEKVKPDFPHFEMRGSIPNVHEAKKILIEQGLDKLWSMV